MAAYVPKIEFASWGETHDSDIYFFKEHAPVLIKLLANASYKWKEIGIALKLPMAVIEECGVSGLDTVRLYELLYKWIVGEYSNSVPTTLQSLRHVLAGPLVQRGDIANNLEDKFKTVTEQKMPSVCHNSKAITANFESDIYFFKEHAPILIKLLANASYKWKEIGIALKLPKAVIEECGKSSSDIVRLYKLLYKWIVGDYFNSVPTTLQSLRHVLAGRLVQRGDIASDLEDKFKTATEQKMPSVCHNSEAIIANVSRISETHTYFSEEHTSVLSDVLVETAYQWEEIGISLQLPEAVLEECRSGSSDTVKLHEVLCKWIMGKYLYAVPATLQSLKCELAGPLVRRGDISKSLESIFVTEAVTSQALPVLQGVMEPRSVSVPKEKTERFVYRLEDKSLLVNRYLSKTDIPTDWPPFGTKKFINLALIKSSAGNNDPSHYSVRGDADDILVTKERIKYEDVFEKYDSGATYLILGRPGGGKTTLVHKVVKDWAKGYVMCTAELVFLIKLRLFNFEINDDILSDILTLYYHDKTALKIVSKTMEREQGKGVCFIIDGLDEYQPQNKRKSVFYALLEKRYLPQAMVIVSSRPAAATASLREKVVAKQIEVFGFTKKQIFDYIDSFPFSSSSGIGTNRGADPTNLKKYLSSHRNVFDMCYLPVHSAMICFLYQCEQGNLPHTQTKIYEQFTRMVVLRHLLRSNENEQLDSLDDLSGENGKYFKELCKHAFNMTLNSQQVISQSAKLPSLGLATTDMTAKLCGFQNTYTFLHQTLQEFLAAYHISTLCESDQTEIISQYSSGIHMLNVWKFYFGLVNFETGVDHRVYKILVGMNRTGGSVVSEIHCAYESQQSEVCNLTSKKTFVFGNLTLVESDLTSLAYVMSSAAAASKFTHELRFVNCGLDDERIKVLMMHLDARALSHLQTLEITCGNIRLAGAEVLATGLQHSMLKNLQVTYSKLSVEVLSEFVHRLKCLHYLNIAGNNLGPGARNLLQCFKYFIYLQELDLSENDIGSDGAVALASACRNTSQLKKLNLQSNNIGPSGGSAFGAALQVGSQLRHFDLSYNNISCEGAVGLASGLRGNELLEDLYLHQNNISCTGAMALAGGLQSDCQVRELDLSYNNIGWCGASALFGTQLQELDLTSNKISWGSPSCSNCYKPCPIHLSAIDDMGDVDDMLQSMGRYGHFSSEGELLVLKKNKIDTESCLSILQELKISHYATIDLRINHIKVDRHTIVLLRNALQDHKQYRRLIVCDGNTATIVTPKKIETKKTAIMEKKKCAIM